MEENKVIETVETTKTEEKKGFITKMKEKLPKKQSTEETTEEKPKSNKLKSIAKVVAVGAAGIGLYALGNHNGKKHSSDDEDVYDCDDYTEYDLNSDASDAETESD